jgi:hypothetical protein
MRLGSLLGSRDLGTQSELGGIETGEVPMNWPVILSGVVSVAALALGFNLLLPLGSGLEPVCVLTGVASAMVFFGLVEGA